MSQRNPIIYAKAIQWHLQSVDASVPVYAAFNRNWSDEATFITWQMRDIHQEVYPDNKASAAQSLKGIDRPIVSITIHATTWLDALQVAHNLLQSWHGYQGLFGDPTGTDKFDVRKIDVFWHLNEYDNEINMHQIYLEAILDIPS